VRVEDIIGFAAHAARGYRTRTLLMLLAMSIGVASVVLLTALGEGARRYVTREFASLGTHLLIVLPGRSETAGGHPPLLGETPRDLTLDDALALARSRHVRRVAPVVVGAVPVSWGGREREVTIVGSTAAFLDIRRLTMRQGRFLPAGNPRRATAVAVIGAKVRQELFGRRGALGEWLRVGDRRFRVIGIIGSEGRSIGLDLEEVVVIPVASAQALFDTAGLFRVLAEAVTREAIPEAERDIVSTIRGRHEGELDVTVITQDAVLGTFNRIFRALTLTVGGIAAISLAVAGILIMNVMLVAIAQRTAEIGLLKALGAPGPQILSLFLTEAALLALSGAVVGLVLGMGGVWVVGHLYPAFPLAPPVWAVAAAMAIAVLAGLVFGVLPARRAAALDPVQALARR
jgi:putative ABC transport system permease protein